MNPLMPITIINIVSALILTTVTGAIFTIVWEIIGVILERIGFFHIRYTLLKLVIFFYLMPVSYIVIKYAELKLGNGYLFEPTPQIVTISMVIMIIWSIGFTLILARLLLDVFIQRNTFRDAMPCDRTVIEEFQRIKDKLGIRDNRIQIMQSYHAEGAYILGIVKPRIILPVCDYSKAELNIILQHELVHYKQRDNILKFVTYIVLAAHFFNPFAWYIYYKVEKLSEIACDYKICTMTGMNTYYETLMLIARNNSKTLLLSSHLAERKNELIERARKMKKILGKKKRSRWSALMVIMTMFIVSSISVYAASAEGIETYKEWYSETNAEEAEGDPSEELIEYTEFGDEEGIKTIIVNDGIVTCGLSNIDWTIETDVKMSTGYFSCAVGDTVSIMVQIDPSDVTIKVGIEYADGSKRYVNASGTKSHDFAITKAGMYKVYIENQSGETVDVIGSYITP